MKKGLAISLSAVLCLSSYASVMPALAVSETAEANSAQAFLDKYAGVEVTTSNGRQVGTTFRWFRTADAGNAGIIVEGYSAYKKLSAADRRAVDAVFAEKKIDYAALVSAAQAIVDEQAAQAEKEAAEQAAAEKEAEEAKAEAASASKNKDEKTAETPQESAASAKTASPAASSIRQSVPVSESDGDAAMAKQQTDEEDEQEAGTYADDSKKEEASAETSRNTPAAQAGEEQTEDEPAQVLKGEESQSEADSTASKEETSAPTKESRELLYTGSLSVDDSSVDLEITGRPESMTKGEVDTIYAWMQKLGITGYDIYGDVVYTATQGKKKAESSAMFAARTPDSLLLFSLDYNEAGQEYDLVEYSLTSISFDFQTGTLNPTVKSTFKYAYLQEQETPSTPETPDNPDTPSNEDKPQTQPEDKPAEDGGTTDKPSSGDIESVPGGPNTSTGTDTSKPESSTPSAGTDTAKPEAGTPSTGETDAASEALAAQNKAQASTFIKTYCTNSASQVYTTATAGNYRQILNGYNSWKKLSAAVRNEINAQMLSLTGKSYAALFKEANIIRLGQVQNGGAAAGSTSLPYTTVNPQTAVTSQAPVHIFAMMMSSLGFFVSLLRKKDII